MPGRRSARKFHIVWPSLQTRTLVFTTSIREGCTGVLRRTIPTLSSCGFVRGTSPNSFRSLPPQWRTLSSLPCPLEADVSTRPASLPRFSRPPRSRTTTDRCGAGSLERSNISCVARSAPARSPRATGERTQREVWRLRPRVPCLARSYAARAASNRPSASSSAPRNRSL